VEAVGGIAERAVVGAVEDVEFVERQPGADVG